MSRVASTLLFLCPYLQPLLYSFMHSFSLTGAVRSTIGAQPTGVWVSLFFLKSSGHVSMNP
jgi:hypothetical protein